MFWTPQSLFLEILLPVELDGRAGILNLVLIGTTKSCVVSYMATA